MERFDYIIVTDNNAWEGSGKQATDDELQQDIKYIKERLSNAGRGSEKLIVYSSSSMVSHSV